MPKLAISCELSFAFKSSLTTVAFAAATVKSAAPDTKHRSSNHRRAHRLHRPQESLVAAIGFCADAKRPYLYLQTGQTQWLWVFLAFLSLGLPVFDAVFGEDRQNPPEAAVSALKQDRFYRHSLTGIRTFAITALLGCEPDTCGKAFSLRVIPRLIAVLMALWVGWWLN